MSKKTETIEIRVSPELKQVLARQSAARGRSMSETIRTLIAQEAAGGAFPQPDGDKTMTRPSFLRRGRAAALALPMLILAALYLVAAQAPATAAGTEARVLFAELDRDGDAVVTGAEIEALLRAEGWRPDAACNTAAPPADLPCTLAAEAAHHHARADSDGDGVVVYAEVAAIITRDLAEAFLDTDIDENGVLSVDEVVAAELHWAFERPERAAEEGLVLPAACIAAFEAERLPGLAAACEAETEGRVHLATLDLDRDGRVSLPEYLAQ